MDMSKESAAVKEARQVEHLRSLEAQSLQIRDGAGQGRDRRGAVWQVEAQPEEAHEEDEEHATLTVEHAENSEEPLPNEDYSQEDYSQEDYSQEDYPPEDYPPEDYPPEDYSHEDYSQEDYPPEDYPQEDYPPEDYPPEDYPPEEYPPEDYPPEDYPPEDYPPEDYPPEDYPPEDYPPEEHKEQSHIGDESGKAHEPVSIEEWEAPTLPNWYTPEPEPEPDNKICTLCIEKEFDKELSQVQENAETSLDPYYVSIRTFQNSPAYAVYLPLHHQYKALRKAHHISKKVFWHAYRKHWPVHCLQTFPESWEQVRFGREELFNLGLGNEKDPGYTCQMCDKSRRDVLDWCYKITPLRNLVSHTSGRCTMANLTGWLEYTERFAEFLHEPVYQMEARKLVTDAMQQARETYAEIEACVGTEYCTGPRTEPGTDCQSRDQLGAAVELKPVDASLPYHIQSLLHKATRKLAPHFKPSLDYSPAIVQAAKLWWDTGLLPGQGPEYDARVEKARSWVKDNVAEYFMPRLQNDEETILKDPRSNYDPSRMNTVEAKINSDVQLQDYLFYTGPKAPKPKPKVIVTTAMETIDADVQLQNYLYFTGPYAPKNPYAKTCVVW